MLKRKMLCLVFAVSVLLAVGVLQALLPRSATAQQPPPSPPPPLSSCCEKMAPGEHTIGGPGTGRDGGFTVPGTDALVDQVFVSEKPRNICVTFENTGACNITVGVMEFAEPVFPSRIVQPGHTLTMCSDRARSAAISCRSGCDPGECTYRWRVDDAR